MKTGITALILLLPVIVSCSDDTHWPDVEEEFILAVMVYDTEGGPLEGMSVGRLSSLEYESGSGPALKVDESHYSYPNPFYGTTSVEFVVHETSRVRLDVLDWRGRRVDTITDGVLTEGMYTMTWTGHDSTGAPALNGVYIFDLYMTDTLEVHEMQLRSRAFCTLFDETEPTAR